MAFTEDLAQFLDTDDFAVAATYNGSTTVNGILDQEYYEVGVGDAGVESSQPVFLCRTADVPAAAHGDTLLIDAITYKVRGVQPDGTGLTRLALKG